MNTCEHTKTFDAVAAELCRRVGLPYPPPKGTKYKVSLRAWTKAEENDFREWLMAYLCTLPPYKRMGKTYIKKEIDWFLFQYGWKYSGGDEAA